MFTALVSPYCEFIIFIGLVLYCLDFVILSGHSNDNLVSFSAFVIA